MAEWTPFQGLKEYSRVLGRKVGFSAIGWLVMYFITQKLRSTDSASINIAPLFALLPGAIGGLVIGWYLATDAVEDSGMTGFSLFTVLVIASWVPICAVELLMWLILRWPMGFGGWMMMMSALIIALAATIWHASSQE